MVLGHATKLYAPACSCSQMPASPSGQQAHAALHVQTVQGCSGVLTIQVLDSACPVLRDRYAPSL